MKNGYRAVRYPIGLLIACLTLGIVGLGQAKQPTKVIPSDQAGALVAEWTRARDYTKEYIDAMPEDGLGFKPTPEIRSFAQQMLHLAGGNYLFARSVLGATPPAVAKDMEKNEELNKSKAALTKAVLDSYDFVIANIKTIDAAKANEQVDLFGARMTRHVALAKAFEHQTHHRGQTTIYLRLKGVKPPPERLL